MKVLIVCSWGNRETSGGLGSFFFDQAKLLKSSNFEVELLFVQYVFGVLNEIEPVESKVIDSIQCHFVEAKSIIPRSARANLPFHTVQLMRKINSLSIRNIDFVICNSMIELSHLAAELKRKFKAPTVLIEHHSAFTSKGQHHEQETIPVRINQFNKSGVKIFAVSEFLKNELIQFRGMKMVHSLFNPVPLEIQNNPFKAPPDGQIRFIAIGRFDHNKRMDQILLAHYQYINNGGRGKLLIITEEKGRERMRELYSDEMAPFVEILFEYGKLERLSLIRHIEKSHVLISFSLFETFGMTVLEAIAIGRPVICSNSGGVLDLVNESNGIICELGTFDCLAENMIRMEAEFESYALEQIRCDTLRNFGVKRWIQEIMQES